MSACVRATLLRDKAFTRPFILPSSQCRSLNAVPSTARAVAAIAAQRALDRPSVASVWAALGEDEQGEFVVKCFETARQHARARGPCREPEETKELERVAIADTRRRHAGAGGAAGHREAHEVVAECEAPHLLRDARGRLAPHGLSALEGMGLHFVEAEFEAPSVRGRARRARRRGRPRDRAAR